MCKEIGKREVRGQVISERGISGGEERREAENSRGGKKGERIGKENT